MSRFHLLCTVAVLLEMHDYGHLRYYTEQYLNIIW